MAVEAVQPVGTPPKICTEWLAIGDLCRVEEDFSCQGSFQGPVRDLLVMTTWEPVTTAIQRRAGTLLGLDELGTWGFRMESCCQVLEELPEGSKWMSLENLGLGRSLPRCHRGSSPPSHPQLQPGWQAPPGWVYHPSHSWVQAQWISTPEPLHPPAPTPSIPHPAAPPLIKRCRP